jgi:hypothetical protein
MEVPEPQQFPSLYELTSNPHLWDQFLAPALHLLSNYVRGVYRGGSFDDAAFLRAGILRVLSQSVSGRDFLQLYDDTLKVEVARSSFFDSLHSPRRLQMLEELNAQLVLRLGPAQEDLLACLPELRQRPIYAVDGHHLAHPVHSPRSPEGDYVSANSLHLLCLRTGLLANFGAVQGDGVRRHEMPAFRERLQAWLPKQRFPQKRRPLLVGDPAFLDKGFWTRQVLARERGADFISRTKANMKPTVYGTYGWDSAHPANVGVLADETVGFDGSCTLRRIRYQDPENGTLYEFLTSEKDLPPGVIAWIYLFRWRIEKLFDTAKNKLQETKAWAVGTVAQQIQASFLALTHNLLVLLRRHLDQNHGIREEKVVVKRQAQRKQREVQAAQSQRVLPPLAYRLPDIVQLTAQFIRSIRNAVLAKTRWWDAVANLRQATKVYL